MTPAPRSLPVNCSASPCAPLDAAGWPGRPLVHGALLLWLCLCWAACYCGSKSAGEPCEPTALGSSECKSGLCIHKCENGAVVNVCAGGFCDENPCRDNMECVRLEKYMRCFPRDVCAGKLPDISAPVTDGTLRDGVGSPTSAAAPALPGARDGR